MKIEDSVMVVTGANRGLGLSLVHEGLRRGARKIYAGSRDPAQLRELVTKGAGRIVGLALDVTDKASVARAAKLAEDATMLVNNAGVLASFGLLTATQEQIERDFAVNAYGVLTTIKAFLPALERAEAAAVVNVLSVASLASLPSLGGYSAAKAAAFSVTQALRAELAKKDIATFAVFPGPIDTDMIRTFDMVKTSPDVVAGAILDGVDAGQEDIFPDPTARDFFETWKSDPRALAARFAAM